MQSAIDQITHGILRRKKLENAGIAELEKLVAEYPYFPVTRFLLARKALAAGDPSAGRRKQETALYVPNTAWLHYVLHEGIEVPETTGSSVVAEVGESVLPSSVPKSGAVIPAEDQPLPVVPEYDEEKTSRYLSDTLQKIVEEAESTPADAVIPVDPYHTIDYFASQGIKLQAEDLNRDQMGRQLKRFTEWLKTMKRIPASESAADIDDATNQNIQNLAAHSLAGTEIVTEAMAEVLVKQQRYDKAIEVYRKLSLHNPGKSPYFASRIEELNQLLS